jgi:hypothetical protein
VEYLDSLKEDQTNYPIPLLAGLDENLPFPQSIGDRLNTHNRQQLIAETLKDIITFPVAPHVTARDVRQMRTRQSRLCPMHEITPTIIYRDRFAGRCVAVTSLSPNPERAERQAHCLESWRNIGLPIIEVIAPDGHSSPRIKELLNAGAETGLPFLVINADIEIYGDHTAIEEAIDSPDKLGIGVRYNHDSKSPRGRSRREAGGLDVFVMTPEMAATVPDLPFTIGMPVWDYWLPHHFRSLGYKFQWMREPLLFHAQHDVNWSREDWARGAAWVREHYDIQLEYGNIAFRESLEVLI